MWLILTGSTGFVGRNFLLKILATATYEKIILPVRSQEKLRAQFMGDGFDSLPPNLHVVESSTHDWALRSLVVAKPTGIPLQVIHSAGTNFARSREEYFKVNVRGTERLLADTEGAEATLILSSQAAAGPCAENALEKKEGEEDSPVTFYGESKLALEEAALRLFPNRNLLILRPPMILGARDTASLPLFKMAKGPVRFKPGRADKTYSFIGVDDLVDAMIRSLELSEKWKSLPRQKYFVASPETVTDRQLIQTCATLLQREGITVPLPQSFLKVLSQVVDWVPALRQQVPSLTIDRAKDIWPARWVASPRSFEGAFQWKGRVDLTTALRQAYEWYRKTGQLR